MYDAIGSLVLVDVLVDALETGAMLEAPLLGFCVN